MDDSEKEAPSQPIAKPLLNEGNRLIITAVVLFVVVATIVTIALIQLGWVCLVDDVECHLARHS